MVVEVTRKAYLASLVPVIVDAILNEHQVIADIVAFVSHGDFPRSRLGEKQRGKVLASWVTRKLRTIAQFSIRDIEGSENPFAETPQPRMSRSSKPGSAMGSLRRSTILADEVPRSPAAVPSPAPVPEEIHELQPHSYDLQDHDQPSELPVPDASLETATPVPQITEPMHEPALDNFHSPEQAPVPSRIDQLDLGSDFSEFARESTVPPDEANLQSSMSDPQLNQPPRGRDSLPSQKRFSSLPGGIGVPFPERGDSRIAMAHPEVREEPHEEPHEEVIEDWPQEALMYQTAWDIDNAHEPSGMHRSPTSNSEAIRKRYDGHDYGY